MSINVKIERGIPIPKKRLARSGLRQALALMKKGDSFTIPKASEASARSAAFITNIKITIHPTDDPKLSRVWKLGLK